MVGFERSVLQCMFPYLDSGRVGVNRYKVFHVSSEMLFQNYFIELCDIGTLERGR